MNIPFVDLKAQYQKIKAEILTAFEKVMEDADFVLGDAVEEFEEAFAAHNRVKHCVAVSSGTSALHLALLAVGVAPGDEVIVPVNTFIATAEAVSHAGAHPVFVDMCDDDYCIDPRQIEAAITPKTSAIIPVHLYGQAAELDEIIAIAQRYELLIIEDCAQAHDAEYRGRKVGTFGNLATFSFYPGKNLGAYGEGGAVLTNDDEMAHKMRMFRNHGSVNKYDHNLIGYNYRMHSLQGAVLGVKLKYLKAWTNQRCLIAKKYRNILKDLPINIKPGKSHARHVYHLFVVQVDNRDAVAAELNKRGVSTGIHYPVPLHLSRAYAHLEYEAGDFPCAEAATTKILSLPMYAELTDKMIEYVGNCMKQIL